jgi:hypothetical protein
MGYQAIIDDMNSSIEILKVAFDIYKDWKFVE